MTIPLLTSPPVRPAAPTSSRTTGPIGPAATNASAADCAPRPASEAHTAAGAAMPWITAGLLTLIALQLAASLTMAPELGLARSTISDLIYAPGGWLLLPLSGALTVVGVIILTAQARDVGATPVAAALATWIAAMAVATIFPTDPPGTAAISAVAEVHRYAAAVVFVMTPVVGWLAARHRENSEPTTLRRRSLWCAGAGLAQLPVSMTSLVPTIADVPLIADLAAVRGIAERLLFVAIIGVLAAVARTLPAEPNTGANPTAPVAAHPADW